MSSARLTPKQKRVLEFVVGYVEAHGFAPTQQEIAQAFGFRSLGTVQNYLVRLERQGFLKRTWNAKRALEVVDSEPSENEVPLLGYVAAGTPIEAVTTDDRLEVPRSMVRGPDVFALRVKGDSMVEDGILDGDYVVVRRQATAANGETVVALVDGEATVKRFYRRQGRVELHPANAAMEPIAVEAGQDVRIEGVVIGVIRYCS
ncbi:MAG: transcriptional repressor LexA [Deferrisomatales bacterium]